MTRGQRICLFCVAIAVSSMGRAAAPRDGQHDFDFEIGSWKTHLSRLSHPLSGSSGEFYDQGTLNGRSILVRFIISDITPTSCRFEQAFSDDGGKTWEVNWIATDTRTKSADEKPR